MKTALRLFALILSCPACLAGVLTITPIPIPSPRDVNPSGLAAAVAEANKIWFTDPAFSQVGYFTLDGAFTKFKLTDATSPSNRVVPLSIVEGQDGNAYFSGVVFSGAGALLNRDFIGKATLAGVVTLYPLPTGNGCQGFFLLNDCPMTNGPGGNLWVAESAQGKLGKITLDGQITEIQIRAPDPTGGLMGITPGTDGNLYATDYNGGSIWKISTQGAATELKIPKLSPQPWGITSAADGGIYFTTRNSSVNSIGKLSAGMFTFFPIPTMQALANGIAAITDGTSNTIWFAETGGKKIGQLDPSSGAIMEIAISNGENPFNIISVGNQIVFNSTAGLTSTDFNLWKGTVSTPSCVPPIGASLDSAFPNQQRGRAGGYLGVLIDITNGVLPISANATGDLPPGWPRNNPLTTSGSVALLDGDLSPSVVPRLYTFTVNVKDAHGCEAHLSVTVGVQPPRDASLLLLEGLLNLSRR